MNTCALAAYHGDPTNDGLSLNFFDDVGVSGSSSLNFDFAGCFVKRFGVNDKAAGEPSLAYITVRDHDRINNAPWRFFQVNDGGSPRTILPGDFFRYRTDGSVEFFITQALLAKACTGAASGGNVLQGSADALAQDDQGNLYLSPGEAGCSVPNRSADRGAQSLSAQNGAIFMIPADAITYGADGNVVDVEAFSAILIFNETLTGPFGSDTVRLICQNAQALRASGSAFSITTDLVGMEIDPNGGTITGAFPEHFADDIDPVTGLPFPQAPRTIPNVLMAWDDALLRSILSTAPAPGNTVPGSVAVINGAEVGSYTTGPDGSQLGCDDQGSAFSFTPTLMGFNLIDQVTRFPRHGGRPQRRQRGRRRRQPHGGLCLHAPGRFADRSVPGLHRGGPGPAGLPRAPPARAGGRQRCLLPRHWGAVPAACVPRHRGLLLHHRHGATPGGDAEPGGPGPGLLRRERRERHLRQPALPAVGQLKPTPGLPEPRRGAPGRTPVPAPPGRASSFPPPPQARGLRGGCRSGNGYRAPPGIRRSRPRRSRPIRSSASTPA